MLDKQRSRGVHHTPQWKCCPVAGARLVSKARRVNLLRSMNVLSKSSCLFFFIDKEECREDFEQMVAQGSQLIFICILWIQQSFYVTVGLMIWWSGLSIDQIWHFKITHFGHITMTWSPYILIHIKCIFPFLSLLVLLCLSLSPGYWCVKTWHALVSYRPLRDFSQSLLFTKGPF